MRPERSRGTGWNTARLIWHRVFAAERILVIQFRQIGDVLLSTPVLRALRSAYPQSYIAFLTEPSPGACSRAIRSWTRSSSARAMPHGVSNGNCYATYVASASIWSSISLAIRVVPS